MKKIFNILMCLAVAAFAASCSDDNDNPYAKSSSVTITDAQLFFGATASDAGRIAYAAKGTVTATTSAAWCKAEVKGDSVFVSVEQNDTRYSRAANVYLHCNGDSTSVSLVQKGITLSLSASTLAAATDDAYADSVEMTSNVDFIVTDKPDWVDVKIVDGYMKVNFAANTTGTFRKGVVRFASDKFADSISVAQYNFDRDVKGSYSLTFYRDTTYTTTRSIKATVNDTNIRLQGININVPYTFDASTMSITLNSGSACGKETGTTYYIYLMLADEILQYWSGFNTGVSVSAALDHDADGNVVAPFTANYSGRTYSTLLFGRFESQSFAQEAYVGTRLATMYRPVLTRVLSK